MKLKLLVALSMIALTASTAAAQDPYPTQCPRGTTSGALSVPDNNRAAQDACVKAVDLFKYMAPQLGISITGGNATLGQGGALGGLGHFSLGLRANVLKGDLPQFNSSTTPSVNGAVATAYTTKSQIIGLPVADVTVGIFGGIPVGLTNIGGLDAIVSASYLPAFNNSTVDVKVPSGSLKLGFGGRLGILQESLLVPGISVTYLQRDLPTVDITSNFQNDTLQVSGFKVKTKAWRAVASKSFLMFGLALGGGRDTYNSSAMVRASVAARGTIPKATAGPVAMSQDLTRTNVFADLSLNLPLFKIIGEVGQVSGGSISTYNSFSGNKADASRNFASVGIRLGY